MRVECKEEEEGPGRTRLKAAATSCLGKPGVGVGGEGERGGLQVSHHTREFEKVLLRPYSSCETQL